MKTKMKFRLYPCKCLSNWTCHLKETKTNRITQSQNCLWDFLRANQISTILAILIPRLIGNPNSLLTIAWNKVFPKSIQAACNWSTSHLTKMNSYRNKMWVFNWKKVSNLKKWWSKQILWSHLSSNIAKATRKRAVHCLLQITTPTIRRQNLAIITLRVKWLLQKT